MACKTELRFIKTVTSQGKPSFTRLINTVEELEKAGNRLRWKPDQIMIGNSTVGYLLYIQHDC